MLGGCTLGKHGHLVLTPRRSASHAHFGKVLGRAAGPSCGLRHRRHIRILTRVTLLRYLTVPIDLLTRGLGALHPAVVEVHVQAYDLSVTLTERHLQLFDQSLVLALQTKVRICSNLLGHCRAGLFSQGFSELLLAGRWRLKVPQVLILEADQVSLGLLVSRMLADSSGSRVLALQLGWRQGRQSIVAIELAAWSKFLTVYRCLFSCSAVRLAHKQRRMRAATVGAKTASALRR